MMSLLFFYLECIGVRLYTILCIKSTIHFVDTTSFCECTEDLAAAGSSKN